jgi:hypothetical protein
MLDFSKLNTRAAADEGAFLHLRHPVTNAFLYTEKGDAVGCMVRGTEGATVQKMVADLMKRPKLDDVQRGLALVSSLVISFVNVQYDGRALTDSQADKELFFGLSESFVEQVLEFAKDRANFFGKRSAA